MLTIFDNKRNGDCEGTSRRDFLRVGTLGFAGLGLGLGLPQSIVQATATDFHHGSGNNKTVIWLWLGGGPTHIETFDPKPSAPAEFRSVNGSIRTTAGFRLGSGFQQLSRRADRIAVVRSFSHQNSGHSGGTHWVTTGYNQRTADNGGGQTHPSIGSAVARYRGPNHPSTGLPTYTRIDGMFADGPSWLGPAYAPFASAGDARRNLELRIGEDRLHDRRRLLASFDNARRGVHTAGLDELNNQAFELVLNRAANAFDVSREDPRTRDMYGRDRLAQKLLLARRLAERGVSFITINYGGWDMHSNINNTLQRRMGELDQSISSFLDDVNQRGLSDEILLVVTGEFGRTPRVNRNAGRDHWPQLSTLMLAGGGLRSGLTVGESTSKAERPKTTPIRPLDLMATIFHVLQIPQNYHVTHPSGRPTPINDGGRPIAELV